MADGCSDCLRLKRYLGELVEFIEANEPRLNAFEAYVNEEGTEVTNLFIHPDAESEDFHMEVAADKINQGGGFLDFGRMTIDVYGKPSDAVLRQLSQMADSGVPVRINTSHLGGFIRST